MATSTDQKTKFGLDQISTDGPEWANWIFRGYFIVSKAVLGWLAYTHLIPQADLYEVMGFITFLTDPIVFGISKMFGIVPAIPDPSLPLLATQQIQEDGDTKVIKPVVVDPVNNTISPVISQQPLTGDKVPPLPIGVSSTISQNDAPEPSQALNPLPNSSGMGATFQQQ